ncbi:hypothetical protein [Cohnella terricola]|uniref:Uncharacterized protein n=1 Tax=Cohnella terricola TaxID=1289167 RepID=A0A559IV72_9BACL|nr:hypothetical protein [Cohnella terricola]TVX91518.1 hypothetical protein FPZ45_24935 [Cohnella terricola]
MSWAEEEEHILNNYSPYTPCQTIFQAVCDELGRYYSNKGFQYAKSRPKITLKDQDLKLQISFWSSGYNTPGEYVNLEIIPSFYSTKLSQKKRAQGQDAKQGYFFGYPTIFNYPLLGREPGTVRVKQIFGDEIERYEEGTTEAVLIHNRNCNVYGITFENFKKILAFIDNQIVPYFNILKDPEKLLSYIEASNRERIYYLNESKFREYTGITFPTMEDHINDALNQKAQIYL